MHLRLRTSSYTRNQYQSFGDFHFSVAFGRWASAAPRLCLGIHPRWRLHIHGMGKVATNSRDMSAARVTLIKYIIIYGHMYNYNMLVDFEYITSNNNKHTRCRYVDKVVYLALWHLPLWFNWNVFTTSTYTGIIWNKFELMTKKHNKHKYAAMILSCYQSTVQ